MFLLSIESVFGDAWVRRGVSLLTLRGHRVAVCAVRYCRVDLGGVSLPFRAGGAARGRERGVVVYCVRGVCSSVVDDESRRRVSRSRPCCGVGRALVRSCEIGWTRATDAGRVTNRELVVFYEGRLHGLLRSTIVDTTRDADVPPSPRAHSVQGPSTVRPPRSSNDPDAADDDRCPPRGIDARDPRKRRWHHSRLREYTRRRAETWRPRGRGAAGGANRSLTSMRRHTRPSPSPATSGPVVAPFRALARPYPSRTTEEYHRLHHHALARSPRAPCTTRSACARLVPLARPAHPVVSRAPRSRAMPPSPPLSYNACAPARPLRTHTRTHARTHTHTWRRRTKARASPRGLRAARPSPLVYPRPHASFGSMRGWPSRTGPPPPRAAAPPPVAF